MPALPVEPCCNKYHVALPVVTGIDGLSGYVVAFSRSALCSSEKRYRCLAITR